MIEYEYHCRRCDKDFTAWMHMKEHAERVPECPECSRNDEVETRIPHVNVKTSRKSAEW